MLLHIPEILSQPQIEKCRNILETAYWVDGRVTAGTQSAQVKNNLQLPEDSKAGRAARAVVLEGLEKSALFLSAALPKQIFPPLFNRYEGETNAFGNHIDNAIRTVSETGLRVRTDLSATLFLAHPEDYDGGELVIEDTYGNHAVKLPAGDLVLYPGSSLHRVEPVTRGSRLASFFWLESMVRETERRRLLFEMDMAILELRQTHGDISPSVNLTGCYHNLLRMWADV
ncbi:Fe2+-dependent dioxygenase [Candidatus Methylospira mobilis]|uniref:Fe2+-dependent dioxygenase n=1 Tax=Candidatus Methylospira mobilis TaxID=1808979 RepID=A0A5Q0BK30_9GAMM|nr:Fe2+-dependent dioxygenase [Candidatus Methylospira mobilis]QFY44245.1 Fe2+-dependent dioxygenase [Candidatus Methylospira mobilis]WNV06325.1 Fe2+-dependent dioxygenase [Candidatus Methylospira mobilis]